MFRSEEETLNPKFEVSLFISWWKTRRSEIEGEKEPLGCFVQSTVVGSGARLATVPTKMKNLCTSEGTRSVTAKVADFHSIPVQELGIFSASVITFLIQQIRIRSASAIETCSQFALKKASNRFGRNSTMMRADMTA